MSTFSSANIMDGNLVLKERTHRIKIIYSMHQYSIPLHNLGKWLMTPTQHTHNKWASTPHCRNLCLHQKSAFCCHLDLWPLALKTFPSMSTYKVNVCVKFQRNPTFKYRDIASCKIGVNRWTMAGETTLKHNAFATYCMRHRHNKTAVSKLTWLVYFTMPITVSSLSNHNIDYTFNELSGMNIFGKKL